MESPDEWLAYDKVPKDLRDMFESRISKRKEVQKRLNSLSDKVTDSTIFEIQQHEVQEKIFIFHLSICLPNVGYHLCSFFIMMYNADRRSHKHLIHTKRYKNRCLCSAPSLVYLRLVIIYIFYFH
jgi:hypothetical protein